MRSGATPALSAARTVRGWAAEVPTPPIPAGICRVWVAFRPPPRPEPSVAGRGLPLCPPDPQQPAVPGETERGAPKTKARPP